MKRLLILLCLTAAVAGCWLGVHLAGAPAGEAGSVAAPPPMPARSAPPFPATAAKAPGVASAPVAAQPAGEPVGAGLLAAYRSSPNYRAFIY